MLRTRLDTLLIDLNSQRDFLHPNGAYPIVHADEVISNLRRLMTWARDSGARVISSLDAHRHTEAFSSLPPHCLDGEIGQRKVGFTLMPTRIMVEADNSFALPYSVLKRYQQVIFRKRTLELFGNPKADRLLTETKAREVWVFGISTDRSVKALVLGLLARGKRAGVVIDACGYWDEELADMARRQMEAKSVATVTTEEFLAAHPAAAQSNQQVGRRRNIA